MNRKERFEEILLDGVLPADVHLRTDKKLQTLLLIKGAIPQEQQEFTPNEYKVLVPLLEAFPRGCKYEALLAAIEDIDEKEALRRLKHAMATGGDTAFEVEVRKVRTMVSRLRPKLAYLKIGLLNDKNGLYSLGVFNGYASFQDRIRAEVSA